MKIPRAVGADSGEKENIYIFMLSEKERKINA